ncbi:PP2C family protein-serine/threonine phosphatase [Terriglobus saanensis]|uniref:Protein serine/threonine phosphatase n=1 Tax=Terriglobus saanensis (strain ATCC BAA-1853 / DSM 23119 / SP1PR4) TaxID=401053 RepID=E8UX20_TERSS|nr:protein phosphatase 2C domain-containing protein [Terriglobus saanensis]ADV81907.1 protein serine/threonine phosphatase [Terriglobus saanensis SP1PR4]
MSLDGATENDGIRSDRDADLQEFQATVEVAALSDIGCIRSGNEDSFGYDLALGLFVVCDGMGGMAAGEVASKAAVDQLLLHYEELSSSEASLEERVREAIVRTNRDVWQASRDHRHLRGMGTTLVAACLEGNHIVICNVGDSRAYFLRQGSCLQVTRDHSYVAEQERLGLTTKALPGLSALQQWITRAVGVGEQVQPDMFMAEVKTGDIVLLASDGLTRYAETDLIAQRLNETASLAEACRGLVDIAMEGGAADNVTCLLLRIL